MTLDPLGQQQLGGLDGFEYMWDDRPGHVPSVIETPEWLINEPECTVTQYATISENSVTQYAEIGEGSMCDVFDAYAALGEDIAKILRDIEEMEKNCSRGIIEACSFEEKRDYMLSGFTSHFQKAGFTPEEARTLAELRTTATLKKAIDEFGVDLFWGLSGELAVKYAIHLGKITKAALFPLDGKLASDAALVAKMKQIDRTLDLGTSLDPNTKLPKFREFEGRVGAEIEDVYGGFVRSPHEGAEWINQWDL
jgi:hypothetical protein